MKPRHRAEWLGQRRDPRNRGAPAAAGDGRRALLPASSTPPLCLPRQEKCGRAGWMGICLTGKVKERRKHKAWGNCCARFGGGDRSDGMRAAVVTDGRVMQKTPHRFRHPNPNDSCGTTSERAGVEHAWITEESWERSTVRFKGQLYNVPKEKKQGSVRGLSNK